MRRHRRNLVAQQRQFLQRDDPGAKIIITAVHQLVQSHRSRKFDVCRSSKKQYDSSSSSSSSSPSASTPARISSASERFLHVLLFSMDEAILQRRAALGTYYSTKVDIMNALNDISEMMLTKCLNKNDSSRLKTAADALFDMNHYGSTSTCTKDDVISKTQRDEINEQIVVQTLQFLLLVARDPIYRARDRNNPTRVGIHEDPIVDTPRFIANENEQNDVASIDQAELGDFMDVWRSGLDESDIFSESDSLDELDTFARDKSYIHNVKVSKKFKKGEINDENLEKLENGPVYKKIASHSTFELSLNSFIQPLSQSRSTMKYGVDAISRCTVMRYVAESELCRALLAAFQGLAGEYFIRANEMDVYHMSTLEQQQRIWFFAYGRQCSLATLSTYALDSLILCMLRDLADTSTVIREFCCVGGCKCRSKVLDGLQIGMRKHVLWPFESDVRQFEKQLYVAGKNGGYNSSFSEHVVGTLISLQKCISGKWKRILTSCQKLVFRIHRALDSSNLIGSSAYQQTNANNSTLCLNVLFRFMQSNDFSKEMGGVRSVGRNLASNLFLEAFCPYMRMLEKWMFFGKLDDRWNEFFLYTSDEMCCNPSPSKERVRWSHSNVLIRNNNAIIPCIIGNKLSDAIRWCGIQKNLLQNLSPQTHLKCESIITKFIASSKMGNSLAQSSFKFEKELRSLIQSHCKSVGKECVRKFVLDEKLVFSNIAEKDFSDCSPFDERISLVEYMQMIRCLFCFADFEIWQHFESSLFASIEHYFDDLKDASDCLATRSEPKVLLFQSATSLSRLLRLGIESRYGDSPIFLPDYLRRNTDPYDAKAIFLLRSVEISLAADFEKQDLHGAKPLYALGSIDISIPQSCWLTDSIVLKLNAIFTLLLQTKYCNRSLHSLRWSARKVRQRSLVSLRKYFTTISKMMHVARCLLNHVLHSTAISHIPVKELRECEDLKSMLGLHVADIEQMFDACMLSPRCESLNGYVNNLLKCAVSYCSLCSFSCKLSYEQDKTLETIAITFNAHLKFFVALLEERIRSTSSCEAHPLGQLFTELCFNAFALI